MRNRLHCFAVPFFCFVVLTGCGKDVSTDGSSDTGTTDTTDVDQDGVPASEDCNDEDAALGAISEDADCDGTLTADDCDDNDASLNLSDADGDTLTSCDGDCDDTNPDINPDAAEICNGFDDDCDSLVDDEDDNLDESTLTEWYRDADQDGYGNESDVVVACVAPTWYVEAQASGFDCDDTDAVYYPGAPEEDCTDPNDYNCDGSVAYEDADEDGWAACMECNDANAEINPDATEICNELDDDCDGTVDDDDDSLDFSTATNWYADSDSDGYGDANISTLLCAMPSGYVADDTDCDDTDGSEYPGADEYCDGDDDDCDGEIDEDSAVDASTWYADADSDSYGDPAVTDIECYQPSGYVADDTDCDDTDGSEYPGADEYCDGDDDDCDGDIDEDSAVDAPTWYADVDSDNYGDASATQVQCYQPSGYVADDTDCDDTDGNEYPGADEYCDGDDDDCDGDIDEDSAVDAYTWYADADSDNYGDPAVTDVECYQPTGYVPDNTDCDDTDGSEYPGADEYCDGDDDDCDGDVDEGDSVDASTWYADMDSDNYGDPSATDIACYQPSGYVSDNTDCDDTDSNEYPGADEYCDGDDDDCDGDIDEDSAIDVSTWYADTDSDNYGDASSTDTDCYQPSGYVSDNTDCNDGDSSINPGASEYCDGVDNNCDGDTDEDSAVDASTWYADVDSDNYGNPSSTDTACSQPSGYVSDNTDCDDTDASLTPVDSDGDGYSTCDGDCDDSDSSLYNQALTVDATTQTLTTGTYTYCSVSIENGATLYISGVVELEAGLSFSVDSSSAVYGDGYGESAASGSGPGGYSSSGGGGGGGYGGSGGLGGYDSSDSPGAGGSSYGSSTSESIQMGSGGGNTDYDTGGAGGAGFGVWAEDIEIAGWITMNGSEPGGSQPRNGGGGSGGGILLVGDSVSINGDLEVIGADGGSGSDGANDGGGGGGGGRIKIFYDSSLTYSGSYDASGGSGGTYGSASYGASGSAGSYTETNQSY